MKLYTCDFGYIGAIAIVASSREEATAKCHEKLDNMSHYYDGFHVPEPEEWDEADVLEPVTFMGDR